MSYCSSYNYTNALTSLMINATYFVDSNFGNNLTGSPEDQSLPYQTLEFVSSLVQPGDIVFVQPGSYSTPTLDLNGAIWYFSAGSTITTLIVGTGQIFGNGDFIGQSPIVNHTSNGPIFVQANSFTTASDYAIIINGTGAAQFYIKNINTEHGMNIISPNSNVRFEVSGFFGTGEFIRLDNSATGELCCKFDGVQCQNGLISTSNSFKIIITGGCIKCNGDYILNISDNSASLTNKVQITMGLKRTECSGILVVNGLSGIGNILDQPNININIQNIDSLNTTSNPVLDINKSFCNLTANRFAFTYLIPGSYVINISDLSILHMSCEQIYNNDDTLPDVGLINIKGNNFSGFRGIFNECFLTNQLVNIDGNGAEVSITSLNMGVQSALTTGNFINNINGSCVVDIKTAQWFFGDNRNIIQNFGRAHIAISALAFFSNDSVFCINEGQIICRIGFMRNQSDNNIIFENLVGGSMGLNIGSIRMEGDNCTALLNSGLSILNIGQILSNNSNNAGIIINDPGKLYGKVGRIIMQNNSCLEIRSDSTSVLNFDEMIVNGNSSYVIYVLSKSEVVLNGGFIYSEQSKYPIYIRGSNAKIDISLTKMSIEDCASCVYINSPDSKINLSFQLFDINSQFGPSAVYINRGYLTFRALKCDIRVANGFPIFLIENTADARITIDYLESQAKIMECTSTGNVWYATQESVITRPVNCFDITPNNGNLTISGYFRTDGDHIVLLNGPNPLKYFRVLNAVLVSNSRNIVSNSSSLNFICNHGIGNNPNSGISEIPIGTFIVDPGVQ